MNTRRQVEVSGAGDHNPAAQLATATNGLRKALLVERRLDVDEAIGKQALTAALAVRPAGQNQKGWGSVVGDGHGVSKLYGMRTGPVSPVRGAGFPSVSDPRE